MKNLFLIFTILFAFISCGNKTNTDSTSEHQADNIEVFESFFAKFKTDSVFQKERVIFPFLSEFSDYDSETDEEIFEVEKIDASNWKFQPFDWEPSYATRQMDAYDQKIETVNDTTTVSYMGVGNGINVQAIFVLKDGKWFYIKNTDQSM